MVMVCSEKRSKERDTGGRKIAFMATGPERSNTLPNFSLPPLNWGRQRQMHCMKIDSPSGLRTLSLAPGQESSPQRVVSGDAVVQKPTIEGGNDCDGGIKLEKEKIRDKCLQKGAESSEVLEQGKEEKRSRPWNLRKRRAACKGPIGGSGHSTAEKKEVLRAKLCYALDRKEVEEDFMKMTGKRPRRRPKKRPRALQKQLDMLAPGSCLTEVTVDTYKVPEIHDNAKR